MKTLIIGIIVSLAGFVTGWARTNPFECVDNSKAQIHSMFVAKDVFVKYFSLKGNPNLPVIELTFQILGQNSRLEGPGSRSLDEGRKRKGIGSVWKKYVAAPSANHIGVGIVEIRFIGKIEHLHLKNSLSILSRSFPRIFENKICQYRFSEFDRRVRLCDAYPSTLFSLHNLKLTAENNELVDCSSGNYGCEQSKKPVYNARSFKDFAQSHKVLLFALSLFLSLCGVVCLIYGTDFYARGGSGLYTLVWLLCFILFFALVFMFAHASYAACTVPCLIHRKQTIAPRSNRELSTNRCGGWRIHPRGTGVRSKAGGQPSARHRSLLQAQLKVAGCRTLRRVKGSGFDLALDLSSRLLLPSTGGESIRAAPEFASSTIETRGGAEPFGV
jgi:hypothetical protein